ncbi:EARP and GARP complex-interacting protein 1 isoform X2 [Hippopotamus amphibius kiboko]|uniref:EARP and GARP complex-interacting protein 1 isoform X2 n=1 Tax=Hippopotamus amphibius kiboko TaxID=575201 RepID=UPI002595D42E|nr:EARP and GARP complex-interacting protein 1 isoform X2 [Hippopotamus amphibius kiboko]
MEDDAPVIYGLEFQARALTPQTAETDAIRFLVGTQSLKYDNQIHIIDFDDENNIINKNVLLHQAGEIWHISASPADKGVLATCYSKTADSRVVTCAAVWRMPAELEPGGHESPEDAASPAHALELLCHLDPVARGSTACREPDPVAVLTVPGGSCPEKNMQTWCVAASWEPKSQDGRQTWDSNVGRDAASQERGVAWEPAGDGKSVISLADNHILLWDLQESSSQAVLASSASLEGKGQLKFTTGRWSPHHNCTQVATANDTAVRGWDTRTMSQIYCIESAHGQLVRDLDFNPNKQYYLASCGDDCRVKFWDTRNVTEPVKTLEEHSHWVWNVRYNHSHDQLVLTGSSDSRVILSNMVSISSEPFGHLVDEDDLSDQEERRPEEKSQEPPHDSVVATYEEHEDSVYAVDWSSADPWLFASLSYDGRLVINRVPRALKYHILL